MTATNAQNKAARRKKKRISKHVMKANEEREATRQQKEGATPKSTSNKKAKRAKQKSHVKDPNEAASYLSSWKHQGAGGDWKFNKNTQSWLLRHCFEPEKVSKPTFALLLEYLKGLKGTTRTRMIADAQRRALRYKEFEKANPEQQQDKADKKEEDSASSKRAGEDENDETRWKRLDAHDKRKEYKRARKVLDVLNE